MTRKDRVFLIGPMGAGKSTIGRRLAARLHLSFVDLDAAIEARTGVDIPRIFDIEGEAGFRRREAGLLDTLTRQPGILLATGGGAILDPENRRHLAERGQVVYLRAGVPAQLARIRHSDRPLLRGEDPAGRLRGIFEERAPLYESLADISIDTEEGPPERIAERLARRLLKTELSHEG
ncbi:shikimate kinase [Spiribacter vilamensis]|uniref:Shikimate kinase n=1 Tax=Spiribacter vilamensis TaxID=531306 RepID=A0A4Q8D1W3_9GAMM|nr:shikimate kinase [Spiribacter vilamensis]RZU99267.1 shikimate kinase [Spiribacter vilamensis]TVO61748.1 shikimate kinase [Spiribacter vilamensis]